MAIEIQKNVLLKDFTTLHIGGIAEYFVSVTTEEELVEAIAFAKKESLAITILGGGSNVLIADEGITGLVVYIAIHSFEETKKDTHVDVTVGAGEILDVVIAKTVEKGYWGLENLSSIPGSVGATPIQNVGAYGVEVSECITTVRVFNIETETFSVFDTDACQFGYRNSFFKTTQGKLYIVTKVTFRLAINPQPKLAYKDVAAVFRDSIPTQREIRSAIQKIRAGKFPDWHMVGTAGSFFKNPIVKKEQYKTLKQIYPELPGYEISDNQIKVPLGYILDKICGYKGVTEGNVGTYEKQALVLIAKENATAGELETFAQTITHEVKTKTNITIEWEVTKLPYI